MGKLAKKRNLRSGESVDILTGADWDEGIATNNRTGVSSISETIGRHHRSGEVSSEGSRASEFSKGQRHRSNCQL
jgi:hypothetical protein